MLIIRRKDNPTVFLAWSPGPGLPVDSFDEAVYEQVEEELPFDKEGNKLWTMEALLTPNQTLEQVLIQKLSAKKELLTPEQFYAVMRTADALDTILQKEWMAPADKVLAMQGALTALVLPTDFDQDKKDFVDLASKLLGVTTNETVTGVTAAPN